MAAVTGLVDSLDSSGAAVLVGEAGLDETALLADMVAIAPAGSAARVIGVQREEYETLSASMAEDVLPPLVECIVLTVCGEPCFHIANEGLPVLRLAGLTHAEWSGPNMRAVDLDGDGQADLLFTDGGWFGWYPWQTAGGFSPSQRLVSGYDEDAGPALVFADDDTSTYLADMTGDGLMILLRVRDAEVCYSPNLGHGCFGRKVILAGALWFEQQDFFDQRRLRFADLDGFGTADPLYVGSEKLTIWFNESDNPWTGGAGLSGFPGTDDLTAVTPPALLECGTTCLVWSSSRPADTARQLRYIDLMGGTKPHLLTRIVATLRYARSTCFYVQDRHVGGPWATRLPTGYRKDTGWTQISAAGRDGWPNQQVLGREETLTLSRDPWLSPEAPLGLLSTAEPVLLDRVMARVGRSARAVRSGPGSCGTQIPDRGT